MIVNTTSLKSAPTHLSFLSFSHFSDSGWFATRIYSAYVCSGTLHSLHTRTSVKTLLLRSHNMQDQSLDIARDALEWGTRAGQATQGVKDPDLSKYFLLCSSFSGVQICCTAGPSRVCAHCIQTCVRDSFPTAELIRSHSMGLKRN